VSRVKSGKTAASQQSRLFPSRTTLQLLIPKTLRTYIITGGKITNAGAINLCGQKQAKQKAAAAAVTAATSVFRKVTGNK
jgi:hypothetical protein